MSEEGIVGSSAACRGDMLSELFPQVAQISMEYIHDQVECKTITQKECVWGHRDVNETKLTVIYHFSAH